jgi:hypothetical protein
LAVTTVPSRIDWKVGPERPAVVEGHVVAQVKAVEAPAVQDLPGGGERREQVALGVLGDQAVEHQLEDAARRLVGADAWIEIERCVLERHHELGGGVGRRCGARQEEERRGRGEAGLCSDGLCSAGLW